VLATSEATGAARGTMEAMSAVPSDTDALPHAPPADTRTELRNRADDFVARHTRVVKVRELTLFDDCVAVTHAARLDVDEHVVLFRARHVTLDGDKVTARTLDLDRSHEGSFLTMTGRIPLTIRSPTASQAFQ